MQTTALEQLASKGPVTIQKKGDNWLVECVRKDEAGFLVGRESQWGSKLEVVIEKLWGKLEKLNIESR
jgi:hypothetical protein